MVTEFDSVDVEWYGHASLKLVDSDGQVVYIDPWSEVMTDEEYERADVIVSTHDHFDHWDKKMVQKLKKRDTVLVCTADSEHEAPQDITTRVIEPNRTVKAKRINFHGVHAYNVDKYREPNKPFHPKGFCTGVVFDMDGTTFYHASDTDPIPEMNALNDIDVAFVPIGGHYTMNQTEAVEAVKMFEPERVVPIHFGTVDQTDADPEKFGRDIEEKTGSKPVLMN
jgi:L-ascorbate metabolism protein UlaG (beta-lactamase superfamily)